MVSVMALSFFVLGFVGMEISRQAPLVPKRVVTSDGLVLFTGQEIKDGQNAWQFIGGEEMGAIWGHGAYVAPDWSADWLHRVSLWLLGHWAAQSSGKAYDQLAPEIQTGLSQHLKTELRTNTYRVQTGDLVVELAMTPSQELRSSLGIHRA